MRIPGRTRRRYRPGRREALVGALLMLVVIGERLRGRGKRDERPDEDATRERQ